MQIALLSLLLEFGSIFIFAIRICFLIFLKLCFYCYSKEIRWRMVMMSVVSTGSSSWKPLTSLLRSTFVISIYPEAGVSYISSKKSCVDVIFLRRRWTVYHNAIRSHFYIRHYLFRIIKAGWSCHKHPALNDCMIKREKKITVDRYNNRYHINTRELALENINVFYFCYMVMI